MAQIGLLFKIYNWIHSSNKLFQSILKTIQIHKQAQESAFEFIVELSYEYYADTFVQKLKIALENNVYSYLKFINQVFPIIYQNTLKKEKFYQSGTLDPLLKIILKSIENDQEAQQQQNEKQVALSLLIKIWINYTNFIEKYRIDYKIVDFIKRGCRSHSKPYRYQCYQYLFSLIHQFASQKNPKVQIIYKTLIFLIIENHQDLESREFFLRNFMEAIFRFPTMPIDILLEPYIKQIQISGGGVKSFINICDIEFIHCVITHRSLNLKLGLLFTDMMLKIYLNNFIWSNCLIGPIQILITKFLDHSLFQNFLLKIIGLSCNDILESYQQDKEQQQVSNDIQEQIDNLQKQQQEQQNEQYEKDIVLSQIQQNESKEMLIQNAQRRALIIELLKFIINLKNYQINDKIKSIVGKVFMDLKDEKIPSKGILMLISLFGDPIKVLEKFQQHYSQSQNNSDIFKQQNVSIDKSLNQSKKRLQTNHSQIVKKEKLKQELGLSPSKEHKSLYKNEFIQNNQNQENVAEKDVFDVDYGIDESLAVLNMQKPNSSFNDNNLKINNSQNVQQIRQSSRQSKPKSQQQYEQQQQLYDSNILNQDESNANQNYQSHRQIPRLQYQNYLPNPQERKFNINSLKSDQANLKSLNYMKQKKLKEQDQRLEKQMELVNRQLQMQKLQNKASNQIAIKNLVNNVAKEGIFNYQPQVVFEENTLDPQILNQTEKNNQIILFIYKEAEIRDQNAITVNLNRYKEGIKYFFKKYHFITDPKANIRNNYNQSILTKKQDKISFADVWRLCKDNDFSVLVSKEEIHQLVKLTNATFGIKSGDIYSLDLESFPAFLIQLAYLSFSREPRDFRGQHMGVIIQAFFNLAVQAMIRRNENPAIIQEPEILNIRGDPEVIRSYNEKLRIDPQIPIPDSYKKYKEQDFGTYYIINDKLKQFIPESQLICYEIINDLVYEVVGSNIIEPVTQIETNVKIKPKPIPIGQKQRSLNQNKQQRLEQNNQIYEIQPKDTISDHRMPNPLQNGKPKNKYNVQSRIKNQSQPPNAQKQDPEWLQQMKKPQKKILNKAMREKMEKQQKEEEEKQKKNLNILQRKHELKNELEEKYKEKLEFGKKKYLELEEINRQKQEMELKKQEQERIRQQENKQKLRQYREQKDEQKKQEQEEYLQALQQYEQEKKEYNDMYIKQKNEEYKNKFQNLQQQRKEQQLQQKQEEYNQKLKEKKFDLQFEDFMKQQKQEHEQFKYMQQQLENLENSAEIQQTYKRYDLVLKSLYNFYLQDSDIIQQEVVSSMFNYQTKEKTSSSKGLTFKEFRYLFLKMAVMGNAIWELIYTNFQNIDIQNEGYDYHDQDEMPNQQVRLVNPNLENIILPMNNEDVESTSPNALLGLIYFLRIPLISKSQINEKLREIKNNKSNNTDPYKRKKDTLQFLELNNLKMDQAQLDNNTSMQSQAQQNINAFQYVIQDEQAQEYKKLMQIREQKKNLFRK
ncbi:Armadillo-type fold [Pseudocohnilembus persalinus]|uniref:Armadillo-type fold n=1 Tax=Pseudocohnilembus persalinus TaxID=266149 RepID=A0A0V0QZ59_PSEPJ|nr:Armadillo-type fold [Pseudocohnilembus persalinus]|eukprot:KRX07542.1 Armadillo-type fold [Pseudocohnilembus persalinus]